jgi:hypothetical protein
MTSPLVFLRPGALEELCAYIDGLPDVEREALARKTYHPVADRTTLGAIGKHYGVTRERVRQLQVKATDKVIQQIGLRLVAGVDPAQMDTAPVMDIEDLTNAIGASPTGASLARILLQNTLGMSPLASTSRLWARDPSAIDTALHELTIDGPTTVSDWDARVAETGLPPNAIEALGVTDKMILVDGHWIRVDRERLDRVILILRDHGGEATTSQILEQLTGDVNERALNEFLRRQPTLHRDSLRKIWTFDDGNTQAGYASTLPALMHVLEEHGPLTRTETIDMVRSLHPVTDWRILQCLSDSRIGVMPDGRYWLVEHGANRHEDTEPPKPENMTASGDVIGVKLTVDKDVLRGSGIPTQRWLAWRLGLDTVPSEIVFHATNNTDGELAVRRMHSNTAFSSLRAAVMNLELSEGCDFIILMRTGARTWEVRHACLPSGPR